ncbi:MAG TPA: DUF4956 domain-containing protein [Flavobacteriales bacterium]|jgi:hypothetical protein|nr:DUF4956 domain-containing protein [Flavobacteriales bacterium]HHZ94304.1 DUF4956 domain-containing protein [Flavobacteriales bacterium]HIB76154.1 DUF4956 domain-containing protein [Flavobacteriales bacterium]HIN42296.1 DUF4956 domain-containing protein [Flavobacteriales bacterium]HIO15926.1 DUF4956 domain-containing protein [Flavobacteriales bacterium]
MDIADYSLITSLAIGFGANIISSLVVVRLIYHLASQRRDYVFTFMLVSTSVYFLCSLLSGVEIEMGFALGLFAIFSIIRYRTDAIPIREMSYLFIVIALAVINALAPQTTGWGIILLANIGIWSLAFILERLWFVKHLTVKIVVYDKIELIKAGRRKELTADLEDRTGVKIHSLEIGKVDLLRDTAVIRVHFYADLQEDHFEETRNTP